MNRLLRTSLWALFFSPLFLFAQTTTIHYVGSSTVANFLREAEPVYGHLHFALSTESESVGGELAILNEEADLAGTAQLPGKILREREDIHRTLIGWDAIALIVHPSNPVQNLSSEQLRDIFTGKITNWSELGGPDLPIHPYIVATGSATRRVFRSAVLGSEDYAACTVISPDGELPTAVQQDPGGIGHISLSFLESLENIHILSVDGQLPDLTNPSYPITRPLYLLWRDEPAVVADFVSWAISPAGQQVVMRRFIGLGGTGATPQASSGTLMVYTETSPIEDGGIFFYPHQPYELYDYEGKLVRQVANHLSDNDELPTRVSLPPGIYKVRAAGGQQEAWASVQPGKLTVLNLALLNHAKSQAETEAPPEILQRFRPYGDFRLRLEDDMPTERFRMRYRVRAGVQLALQKQWSLNFRLASSADPENAHSTHVDVRSPYRHISLVLDRAYINYRPGLANGLSLRLGRFPHGFASSRLYSELIWDSDIQVDGLAFTLAPSGKFYRLYAGAYLLGYLRPNASAPVLTSLQWVLTHTFSQGTILQWQSGGYFLLSSSKRGLNIDGGAFGPNRGNAVRYLGFEGPIVYESDFYISSQVLSLRFPSILGKTELKGQWIHNFGAETDNNGWVVGFSFGDLNRKNHWMMYYQFQYLEQESVFTPFANDDMPMTTNYRGHVAGLSVALSDKVVLHNWALWATHLEDVENKALRLRMDLNIKF